MTVELACSQESRNRHSLRFLEVNPTFMVVIKADFATMAYCGNETGAEAWLATLRDEASLALSRL
jgi:hypothetical protein